MNKKNDSSETESKKSNSNKKEHLTISWEVLEFEYVEKTKDWYWIVGILGLMCAGIAYIVGSWTLGILIVVSTFLLCYMASHRPEKLNISLDHKHIKVNGKKYNTKELESYYIDEESNKLLIKYKSGFKPLIILPLGEEDIEDDIVDLLEGDIKLEEDEELREPWIEVMMHKLGF